MVRKLPDHLGDRNRGECLHQYHGRIFFIEAVVSRQGYHLPSLPGPDDGAGTGTFDSKLSDITENGTAGQLFVLNSSGGGQYRQHFSDEAVFHELPEGGGRGGQHRRAGALCQILPDLHAFSQADDRYPGDLRVHGLLE